MKVRVVVDIALIGWAYRNKSYARGVHRVAEQIVGGLIAANECDLQFVATSSLFAAHEALANKWPGCETKLHYHSRQFALSRWADRIFSWIGRTLVDRRFHMRAMRLLLHRLARWADSRAESIPETALENADIYHSPLAPIPQAARAHRKIKCFLTVHDLIPLTHPETVGGKGTILLRQQLDSIPSDAFAFCVSETVRTELLSLTPLKKHHVFVTSLAADPKIFRAVTDRKEIGDACRRYKIPDCPYFLVLSSFDPRKNFERAIESFANLVEAGGIGNCNLLIVGSNPEKTDAVSEALFRHPTFRGRIMCPGFIPDEDIAPIYSGALAFLFPSLAEGFGMPPLEAMQCGAPVIASNAPAIPEVVGDAAALLSPSDVEGWGDAMENIWQNPKLREEMAERGLVRSREFSWGKFIRATLAGYQRAMETSGGQRA